MDKLTCMQTFCAVVKEGGFSAAARKLGTSKVMVSRNIAALEADLELRLLQRTTRKMSPTDDGRAYFERCLSLLEDFDALESSIKDRADNVSGKLRFSVPSEAFTSRHLLPFFTEFSQKYPQLELDINLSDRYVDIVEEGFDASLRIGNLEDSSLVARKLADMEILLCASANYLDSNAAIEKPEDINHHNIIADSNYRGGTSCAFHREEQNVSIKLTGNIRINSSLAVITFLKQGAGLGLCPSFMITHELESGELRRVLPEWQIMRGGIYLMYSHRKHLSAKIRLLADELSAYFSRRRI